MMQNPRADFRVFSASAGSGKTFRLAAEYLAAAMADPLAPGAFRHILALTFMNKAAQEMKERVLNTLTELDKLKIPEGTTDLTEHHSLGGLVQELLGVNPEEVQIRARNVLRHMLHDYGSVAIGTLDQFTYRLVRTFASELGLPSQFDVEMDQEMLLEMAMAELYQDLGDDAELTELVLMYVRQNIEDESNPDIHKALMDMAKQLTLEASIEAIKDLGAFDAAAHLQSQAATRKVEQGLYYEARELKAEYEAILEALNLEEVTQVNYWESNMKKLMARDAKAWLPTKTMRKAAEAPELIFKKGARASNTAWVSSQGPHYAELVAAQATLAAKGMLLKAVRQNDRNASVLMALKSRLDRTVERLRVQPIWRFNQLIREALKDEPAPFLYEQLGARFRHFLVDEAQDTSAMQWANLWPLMGHSLSSLSGDGATGQALVVGDGKQSIYRWRGSRAEGFLELVDRSRQGAAPVPELPSLRGRTAFEALDSNYRSREEIVNFNNAFFQYLMSAEVLPTEVHRGAYADVAQKPQTEPGGLVEIRFIEEEYADERRAQALDQLVEDIRGALARGWRLADMAILTHTNKQGRETAAHLAKANIDVLSSELLTLGASNHAQAIMALLSWMLRPEYKSRQWMLVHYCHEAKIAWRDEASLMHASDLIMAGDGAQAFVEHLDQIFPEFDVNIAWQLGLYEMGEYICRAMGIAHQQNPFVMRLLDAMYDFGAKKVNRVEAFVELWPKQQDQWCVAAPDGQDAITLLTIHRAKGLEFPIVFLPYGDYANSRPRFTWMDDSWADPLGVDAPPPATLVSLSRSSSEDTMEKIAAIGDLWPAYYDQVVNAQGEAMFDDLNVYYVGMTRPADAMIIYTSTVQRAGPLGGWLADFLCDEPGLSEGLVRLGAWPDSPKEVPAEAPPARIIHSENWTDRVRLAPYVEEHRSQRLGRAVHLALELTVAVSDADEAVRQVSRTLGLDSEERREVQRRVQHAVQHPEMKPFFEAVEVYTERPLVVNQSMRRPDRVMKMRDGSWSVLDYKTGEPKSSHGRQINAYAQALEEALGVRPSAHVVYLREDNLTIENHGE